MINQAAQSLMEIERKNAKRASIVVGVVNKEDHFITGTIDNEIDGVETKDRVFEIGSTTKTFTSLLLAKLVLNNTIALDEPISSFKPEYKNALSYNGKEVTFRHLATHRSSLPREDMKTLRKRMKEHKNEKDNPYKYFTPQDFNKFFIDYDLKKDIDTKWNYSNAGYGLLANVLSELVGTTYEEAIKENILVPLKINDTFITGDEAQLSRYIQPYNKKAEPIRPIMLPAINGAGALKSTMNDMLHYLKAQMGLIQHPIQKEMDFTHQIHSTTQWKDFNMGLGWFIENKKWSDFPIIHHGGTTMGFHTYCGFIKEKQIGVVISSTIQLKNIRIIKMLLKLTGIVNENIAKEIFMHNLKGTSSSI